jgi:hypothetical protein
MIAVLCISQAEIALFAFHRPDIFPCKLYGCNISIKYQQIMDWLTCLKFMQKQLGKVLYYQIRFFSPLVQKQILGQTV